MVFNRCFPCFGRTYASGFTLSELLISLVILGVIVTFAVPKVLTSQQDSKRMSIFRESLASINEIMYNGMIKGDVVPGACNGTGGCGPNDYPFNLYVQSHLSYITSCSQSIPQGCWVNAACVGGTGGGPGYILANGASLCGLSDYTSAPYDNFWVDWNGPNQGSNTEGDDQVRVTMCWASGCPNGQRPGTIIPYTSGLSTTLYNQIFSTQ